MLNEKQTFNNRFYIENTGFKVNLSKVKCFTLKSQFLFNIFLQSKSNSWYQKIHQNHTTFN